ncbi:hypothetical protein F4692_003805 [Nocardioides cavernae]|uniref:Uncharacterized protein n=1 Tax=Nocardioides cavernae TaxID=1921566 RepID=A0A7Y9H671_9ACTN|nr:hypothetical protein [Nocardioides cavernae]NYE38655.1 hypothetical protein [Nocardioides cavernae]
MIMLLALPIIAAVALAHRYLRLYAPSNLLIRRVRASRPTMSTFAAMLTVAAGLIVGTKVLSDAVAAGAPGWLNLVVLVLAVGRDQDRIDRDHRPRPTGIAGCEDDGWAACQSGLQGHTHRVVLALSPDRPARRGNPDPVIDGRRESAGWKCA